MDKITHLATKPEYQAKISEAFEKFGFHEVFNNKRFYPNRDYYKKLTISLYSEINEDSYSTERLYDFSILSGYRLGSYCRRFYGSSDNDLIYMDSQKGRIVIGRYCRERNLVLIIYPIINNINTLIEAKDNKYLDMWLEVLEALFKEVKLEQVVVDGETILVENFMRIYTQRLTSIENEISGNSANILDFEQRIMEYSRKVALNIAERGSITSFIANGRTEMKKQLEEVKTLPFIKSIDIETANLVINVGDINIDVQGKPVYIGEMFFTITPTTIDVDLTKRNKVWESGAWRECIHPHVCWNETNCICFGERGPIIHELLAKLDLKKLMFMLYLWAKSYNPTDKYVPIGFWTEELGLHPDEIARREALAKGGTGEVTTAVNFLDAPSTMFGIGMPTVMRLEEAEENDEDTDEDNDNDEEEAYVNEW